MRFGCRLLLLSLLTTALTGCRYDGAFMQMDSNAPFPFFGFQLAVDSGVRPSDAPVGAESGATLRPDEIVPLREVPADGLDVPVPRLRRVPEQGLSRTPPSLLVKWSGSAANGHRGM